MAKVAQNIIPVDNITDEPNVKIKPPRLKDRLTEELVFSFVGPVGSGCTASADLLEQKLKNDFGYEVHRYKPSSHIQKNAHLVNKSIPTTLSPADRISLLQEIGDELRKEFGNSYLAGKVIEDIALLRNKDGFGASESNMQIPLKLRRAHIIDSLKNPEELELLRSTYGEIHWLFGVFAPFDIRKVRLQHIQNVEREQIEKITSVDYKEDYSHGQNVRDVFHQSDFFIRNDRENTSSLENFLDRFLEILFSSPVHTPTSEESAMYAAYAEATKSACLSRQVGAAIVNEAKELIGVGRNDVPRSTGGLYKEDDGDADHRCHAWQGKVCHNDRKKTQLYEQIFNALKADGLLTTKAAQKNVTKAISSTDVKSLIEYSRAVHAEMDAIVSVARSNKSGLKGGTLFSTTFPCHSCARHIVASGIMKVYFIEPYPKSLAIELHSDSISEDETNHNDKVVFLQYTGIAPKNILKLFSYKSKRKVDGKLRKFNKLDAKPIVSVSLDDYSSHEKLVIAELSENEKKSKEPQTAFTDI